MEFHLWHHYQADEFSGILPDPIFKAQYAIELYGVRFTLYLVRFLPFRCYISVNNMVLVLMFSYVLLTCVLGSVKRC